MKIKVYTARDMRTALRMVRDEQGPDAVILSTRSGANGVEVEVAIEVEQAVAIAEVPAAPVPAPVAPASTMRTRAIALPPAPAPIAPVESPPPFAEVLARTVVPTLAPAPAAAVSRVVETPRASVHALPAREPDLAPRVETDVNAELRSMRHLLETQLGRLAWNDTVRRSPAQAELLKQLTELGLAEEIASELAAEVPASLAFDEAQRRVLAHLSRKIAVTGDDLLDHGGRVAFVGPTGIGKTTLIAKLAARWVMRHGARDVALVSVDSQRFGAQEQLRVLGRLLGVEAFCVEDAAQLPELLARLSTRRFVLVDTAGQSPRDPQLAARADEFVEIARRAQLRVCLTLSCAAQAGVIADALARFAAYRPSFCVLTKLDEASSLGGTLSALVKHQIAVAYVSDGQRIPEDLNPARAHQLVSRAVQLTRIAGATAGEDLLMRRFGGVAHGLA